MELVYQKAGSFSKFSNATLGQYQKPHFALVVFNDPEIGQYIGNCQREGIIKALRETADRLERNQDLVRS